MPPHWAALSSLASGDLMAAFQGCCKKNYIKACGINKIQTININQLKNAHVYCIISKNVKTFWKKMCVEGGTPILHVTNIFKYQENGVTHPIYCRLSNGNHAIVKYMNNPDGQLPLVNEFVCSQLASKYQLSTPQSGVCLIDHNTHMSDDVTQDSRQFSQHNFGCAFYSTFIEKSTPPIPGLIRSINKDQLARLIVFDHIVYNKDRHNGNLLLVVQDGNTLLYAIDHSHVFKNMAIWDHISFEQGMRDNDYNDTSIMEYNSDIYRAIFDYAAPSEADFCNACNVAKAELTADFLHSIMEQIPSLWTRNIEQDIIALEKYLLYRIAHLDQIKRVILKEGGLSRE